jgi:pyridoxal phosphate enzyme (YggS family)
MDNIAEIEASTSRVRERIAAAAQRAGRRSDEITLVAVAKTHPVHIVAAAIAAGLHDIGENRVEEASTKIPAVRERISPLAEPRWHMVGHLQRRKARTALALFDLIHSIDSLRLAQRINRVAQDSEKVAQVLLEINVSGEVSKYGFDLSASGGAKARDAFFADVEQILALPYVQPRGLMTMAPIVSDPENARPVFAALRAVHDDVCRRFPDAGWRELSMGMTDDYEVAIEEGATMVRVGRAIFGERGKFR